MYSIVRRLLLCIPLTVVVASPSYAQQVTLLCKAEDAGPSNALRPTRAHKVVGCVSWSLPQYGVGREFHEKGSSEAVLAVCDRKLESVTPTSRTPFGGGNTDRIRSRAI